MSFGHLAACPCCWEDPEDCKCTEDELNAYYKRVEENQKRIKEFNEAGHKDPLWEVWEVWENYKKQINDTKST